jgi:hypothetical protein
MAHEAASHRSDTWIIRRSPPRQARRLYPARSARPPARLQGADQRSARAVHRHPILARFFLLVTSPRRVPAERPPPMLLARCPRPWLAAAPMHRAPRVSPSHPRAPARPRGLPPPRRTRLLRPRRTHRPQHRRRQPQRRRHPRPQRRHRPPRRLRRHRHPHPPKPRPRPLDERPGGGRFIAGEPARARRVVTRREAAHVAATDAIAGASGVSRRQCRPVPH